MRRTFEQWMALVDAALVKLCGLVSDDLADHCYSDWYADGCSAVAAARRVVKCEMNQED